MALTVLFVPYLLGSGDCLLCAEFTLYLPPLPPYYPPPLCLFTQRGSYVGLQHPPCRMAGGESGGREGHGVLGQPGQDDPASG